MPNNQLPSSPLIPDYSPANPKPLTSVQRFLIIIPLTIVFFFLLIAGLVMTILPDNPLIVRLGGAAILATGVGYFVYWLIRSYRIKYRNYRPMTAMDIVYYILGILAFVGLRVLLYFIAG